jgi:hypothetical protein
MVEAVAHVGRMRRYEYRRLKAGHTPGMTGFGGSILWVGLFENTRMYFVSCFSKTTSWFVCGSATSRAQCKETAY